MKYFLLSVCAVVVSFAHVSFAQQVPRPAPAANPLVECKGKPAIVAFIVTTCGHCKAFTRDVMEPLSKTGVCTVAIAFDQDGDTARFVREQRLTFPVYKLERSVTRTLLGMTGPESAIGTPQLMFIDKHGIIQAQSKPEGSPLLLQPEVIRQIVEKLR